MTSPLNQIFYGPPGTGKTYNVSLEAEKIVNFNVSSRVGSLDLIDKFDRILKAIRKRYSTREFNAKNDSVYRNDRAIMWMLGYIIRNEPNSKNKLTVSEAEKLNFPKAPSNWAQRSQLISHFKLVDDWRNKTLELNANGIALKELVKKNHLVDKIIEWDEDCPEEVCDYYVSILQNQKLEDFTPVLKTFFCALNMLINGQLYKQNNEDRIPSDEEWKTAKKYFDLNPNITKLKWIGHIGRILQGLRLVELNKNEIQEKQFYEMTKTGKKLVNHIINNWVEDYPHIFKPNYEYDTAVELGLIHFVTFHQSYSYEEFIEGIRPNLNDTNQLNYELVDGIFKSICTKAKYDRKNNYVIIIDEINRGNISKIFGELITLIEPTKRLYSEPKENPQSVTLPYSKSFFSVPNNVYIIGTMNTADRSITSIDSALRRRFSFKEFLPMPSLIKEKVLHDGQTVVLSDVLTVINKRIEYLLDKDHLIGHSYFMKIKTWDDLCETMNNNIIPLLQEYFYNDWEKIALVMGDTDSFKKNDDEKIVIKNKFPSHELFKKDYFGEDIDLYFLNNDLTSGNYQKFSVQFFLKGFK